MKKNVEKEEEGQEQEECEKEDKKVIMLKAQHMLLNPLKKI